MAEEAGKVLTRTLQCGICWETMISTDHNHVALEEHGGRELWVHRKGAMSAQQGEPGVLPGSMAVSATMWKDAAAKRRFVQALTAQAEP